MFRSLNNFTIDKSIDVGKFKIRHEKYDKIVIELYKIEIVHILKTKAVVTLNSGGMKNNPTKVAMNTALRCVYGQGSPSIFMMSSNWNVQFNNPGYASVARYFDGIAIKREDDELYRILNSMTFV